MRIIKTDTEVIVGLIETGVVLSHEDMGDSMVTYLRHPQQGHILCHQSSGGQSYYVTILGQPA